MYNNNNKSLTPSGGWIKKYTSFERPCRVVVVKTILLLNYFSSLQLFYFTPMIKSPLRNISPPGLGQIIYTRSMNTAGVNAYTVLRRSESFGGP